MGKLYIDFVDDHGVDDPEKILTEEVSSGWQKLRTDLKALLESVLEAEGFSADAVLSLTFTDDDGIQEINRIFRGKDAPTDVLSFPMLDGKEQVGDRDPETNAVLVGDIVISLQRARVQAELFGHSFRREVGFLAVHGMLHLLGYDHRRGEREDLEMREKQRQILLKHGWGRTS
jgi:probable rRNA maturation factor